MLYSLRGNLSYIEENFIVVECGGVGYKCFTTVNTQRELSNKVNNTIMIYTYMNVREDAIDLFGFSSISEMKCFKLLTSVSGVGSKAGLSILSEYSTQQVAMFISSNNSKALTKASGIGNKIAQRIVLELRDKFKMTENTKNDLNIDIGVISSSKNIEEAVKALGVLGYEQSDIMPIINKFDSSLSVEELIRLTLKSMK